jgi:hypothetical protein
MTWEEYWKAVYGLWECEHIDTYQAGKDNDALVSPTMPEKTLVYAQWVAWNSKFIRIYNLPVPQGFLQSNTDV